MLHVCLTTNSADAADKQHYLLLIQVSLSSYSEHRSKAIDIREAVTKPEKDIADLSVAEFYRYLAKKDNIEIDAKHVVYIYASPKELRNPRPVDFVAELRKIRLKGGISRCPQYHYGFVDHDCIAGHLLLQLNKEVKHCTIEYVSM